MLSFLLKLISRNYFEGTKCGLREGAIFKGPFPQSLIFKGLLNIGLIAIFGTLLSQCATYNVSKIANINVPLKSIQGILIKELPEGKRKVSLNGREFLSNYFIPHGSGFRATKYGRRRYYAHYFVLGDRRPYKVEVIVHLEEAVGDYEVGSRGNTYSEVGTDWKLAERFTRKIKRALSERPDPGNVIDDFRVF